MADKLKRSDIFPEWDHEEFIEEHGEEAYKWRRFYEEASWRCIQIEQMAEEQGVELPYEQVNT